MTIFDHLIAGALPASFVHQDERCVAFMDISPITPGHVLVVPRQSVATLDALDAETRAHLWEVARKVGVAQRQRWIRGRGGCWACSRFMHCRAGCCWIFAI